MITVTFSPSISSRDIAEALGGQATAHSSEALKAQLSEEAKAHRRKLLGASVAGVAFGLVLIMCGFFMPYGGPYFKILGLFVLLASVLWFISGFISDWFPPPQNKPEGVFDGFYQNLLGPLPNYNKAYRMLAPASMARMPLTDFRKAWETVPETLRQLVATQDKAYCSRCGKEGFGLWTFPSGGQLIVVGAEVVLSNKYLASSRDFVHCPKCECVYCASCFLALPDRGACQGCSTLLKGKGLKTMMVEPAIRCSYQVQDTSKVVEQEPQGTTTHIICEIKSTNSEYSAPWEKLQSKYHKLGEKGVLTCRFHNAAVRIGEKWYVVAGDPGVMERQSN
jgi:hypothetical protein